MAAISTRVPEEESLIEAEDLEALAFAQEDDSIHIRESADGTYTSARSWRLGLSAVGILCAVALLAGSMRVSTPQATLLQTKDVEGVTRLQYAPQAVPPAPAKSGISGMFSGMFDSMTGGMTKKFDKMYDSTKKSMLAVVPKWAGGTLGETTTLAPVYGVPAPGAPYGAAAPYVATTLVNGMPYAVGTTGSPYAPPPMQTTIIAGKAYALPPSMTTAAPYYVPQTTIINGRPYALPPPVAPPAGVNVSVGAPRPAYQQPPPPTAYPPARSAAPTQPPISVTDAPPGANQSAEVQASLSTVAKDNHVTNGDAQAQAATNPYGVLPCDEGVRQDGTKGGVRPDGTPCTALKTYAYPPSYAGYTTLAPPQPTR